MSRLQAADAEVRLCGVPQEGRLVGHAVEHVDLVTLREQQGPSGPTDCFPPGRGAAAATHPALVEAFLPDGQTLPEEEDVVVLRQDLQGFGSRKRNCSRARLSLI